MRDYDPVEKRPLDRNGNDLVEVDVGIEGMITVVEDLGASLKTS